MKAVMRTMKHTAVLRLAVGGCASSVDAIPVNVNTTRTRSGSKVTCGCVLVFDLHH